MSTKVIVVYESKFGNTKLAAETTEESIREVEGMETVLTEIKEVELSKIPEYDLILVGSPNHIGGPTRGIKKFIDRLGKLPLEGKKFAVFDTYVEKEFGKAVKKMEKGISEKVPGSELVAPGLSIRVQGMKGPISDGELTKCIEFGDRIATQLKA